MKQQRNYAWLAILIVFVLAAIPSVLPSLLADKQSNKIVCMVKDERGLNSVVYVQEGNEWALDYISDKQLDSLKLSLNAK